MKQTLIIILYAAIPAILMHYLLITLGFDFNRSIVFGVSGGIFGGWANSYLKKNKLILPNL